MSTATVSAPADPASRTASSWAARRAALLSRNVPSDDDRIREADAALAYWRCRRVIDAERGHLSAAHVPALADMLRHPHAAVMA